MIVPDKTSACVLRGVPHSLYFWPFLATKIKTCVLCHYRSNQLCGNFHCWKWLSSKILERVSGRQLQANKTFINANTPWGFATVIRGLVFIVQGVRCRVPGVRCRESGAEGGVQGVEGGM